jgi:type II restriction enzyme
VLYIGDTANKLAYQHESIKDTLDAHSKLPDVILECNGRLVLIENVTSHGPIDDCRAMTLRLLFADRDADPRLVNAFPDWARYKKYPTGRNGHRTLAWGTEEWVSTEGDHLIRMG